MKADEFRELVKDKFEEITEDEFLGINERNRVRFVAEDEIIYFKPKEQWPKYFETHNHKIDVDRTGNIGIKQNGQYVCFVESLAELYDAVELSKEQRGKK